jgi:hypothetical protein
MSFISKATYLALFLTTVSAFANETVQQIIVSDDHFSLKPIVQGSPSNVVIINEKFVSQFSDYIPDTRRTETSDMKSSDTLTTKSLEQTSEMAIQNKLSELPYDDFFLEIEYSLYECGLSLVDSDLAIRKKFNALAQEHDASNDYALLLTKVLEEQADFIIEIFPRFKDATIIETVDVMVRDVALSTKRRLRIRQEPEVKREENFVAVSGGFSKQITDTIIYPSSQWFARQSAAQICGFING